MDVLAQQEKQTIHELFFGARELCWAVGIDGEILVNDVEIETPIEVGKCYKAKITQLENELNLAQMKNSIDEQLKIDIKETGNKK